MSDPSTPALEALDRFLEELRREFRANPEFAHRVVKSLGAEVSFEGKLAAKLLNPRELVSTKSEEAAKAVLSSLSLTELKTLAKTNNLATAVDVKGRSREELVEMVYARALAKSEERKSQG